MTKIAYDIRLPGWGHILKLFAIHKNLTFIWILAQKYFSQSRLSAGHWSGNSDYLPFFSFEGNILQNLFPIRISKIQMTDLQLFYVPVTNF